MRVRNQKPTEKIEINMTPMIDIVFQLLAFFIMTFKIVSMEGDFNIKMPLAAPSEGTPDENLLPPIKIQLRAGAGGDLAGIKMGERDISGFTELRQEVFNLVGDGGGGPSEAGGFEVEFACDYDLDYKHVIDAITHVTGRRAADGKIIKLIEKIKFAPPQKPGG